MSANVAIKGLFCCFAFDVLQMPLLTFLEERVFEYQIIIVLFDFMKVIHVELS